MHNDENGVLVASAGQLDSLPRAVVRNCFLQGLNPFESNEGLGDLMNVSYAYAYYYMAVSYY